MTPVGEFILTVVWKTCFFVHTECHGLDAPQSASFDKTSCSTCSMTFTTRKDQVALSSFIFLSPYVLLLLHPFNSLFFMSICMFVNTLEHMFKTLFTSFCCQDSFE